MFLDTSSSCREWHQYFGQDKSLKAFCKKRKKKDWQTGGQRGWHTTWGPLPGRGAKWTMRMSNWGTFILTTHSSAQSDTVLTLGQLVKLKILTSASLHQVHLYNLHRSSRTLINSGFLNNVRHTEMPVISSTLLMFVDEVAKISATHHSLRKSSIQSRALFLLGINVKR